MTKSIRRAAVAGQFYLANASRLKFKINEYLENVKIASIPFCERGRVKAIMVPHAGYDYSGQVAAYGYRQIENKKINNVFIIGNSHNAYFDGIAVDNSDAWETPLGLVEVNKELAKKIITADGFIRLDSEIHVSDHCLEVQLPFLQTVLPPGFKIVPILFGNTGDDSYRKIAQALKNNFGENDIVIISSDMSHYPSYADANRIDRETLKTIESGDIKKLDEHIEKTINQDIDGEETLMCGIDGIRTVLELYNSAGWNQIKILHYANSGDTEIRNKQRVVGYGAVAFVESRNAQRVTLNLSDELNIEQQKILLSIAKQTVESYARGQAEPEFLITDQRLESQEGAFVTLKKYGALRGCIGQIEPTDQPLWEVVRDMAIAASSEDPRFSPVTVAELQFLEYEISVLSVPKKINNWQDIKLGIDGVIVQKGWHGGVFLPQVATETGWDLETFLSQLCAQKAGLPIDCYKNDPDLIIKNFQAQVF